MHTTHAVYQIYGVHIASALALPLPPSPNLDAPDVTIRPATIVRSPGAYIDEGLIQYKLKGKDWLLHYRDAGTFCIQGADTLLVDALPDASATHVHRRLLGSVLGLLLRRRGLLVLHANVLWCNGAAILLLGDSGAGKSTLSGALCQQGYRLLSDDLGVLRLAREGGMMMPGLAHLKLRPDSAAALRKRLDQGRRWDATAGKYLHTLEALVSHEAIPLRAAYVLEPGVALSLSRLPVREALLALIKHAHLPRSLDVTRCTAQHFLQATWVARHVPMYRLVRGSTLSTLGDAASLIDTPSYAPTSRP